MSKKFNLKSAIEIAIAKEMDVPDEGTGLILHKFGSTLKQEEGDEFQEKRASSEKDLAPTQAEMDMINASAKIEQDPGSWYVFRNINVTGPLSEVDSHGDVFSMQAAKTMASQVTPTEASPVLTDHWHDLGDRPPVGKAITAKASARGLIESWAIPKEDYNSSIVKGLLNGTINKISIGAFINPADKICNSCGNKSIYDGACPHIPNRKDEKGNMVTVTIKDVKRYAERSLVNIPARLGTGMKSMDQAPDQIIQEKEFDIQCAEEGVQPVPANSPLRPYDALSKEPEHTKVMMKQFSVMKKHEPSSPPVIMDLPLDYEDVYLQILVPEGKDLTGANGLGIQNFVTDKPYEYFKFSDTPAASTHLLQTKNGEAFVPQIVIDHKLFPDNESVNEGNFVLSVFCSRKELAPTPPATIPDVINEDSIVAEKDVKAPEAQEPSEKEEIIAPEAPAAEEKAEAPEPQEVTIEVPVVKSLEVEELTKSFKLEVEPITKALAEVSEKHAQLMELQEKNAKDLGALTETVTKIAQHVVELAQFSSEDAINQVIELVSQLKDQKSAEPSLKAPDNFNDFVSSLVAKK